MLSKRETQLLDNNIDKHFFLPGEPRQTSNVSPTHSDNDMSEDVSSIKKAKCSSSPSPSNSNSSSNGASQGSSSKGEGGGGGVRMMKKKSREDTKMRSSCNCDELRYVHCTLETKDLWDKFHDLETEMIITKTGRYINKSPILLQVKIFRSFQKFLGLESSNI